MKFVIYLFSFFSCIHLTGQSINALYGLDTIAYGSAQDHVNDAVFNNNQELFVAGFLKRSPAGGGTVAEIGTLSRFDPSGNLVYSKTTSYEEINAIARTPEGNLLLTGRGTGLLCNGVCKADFWVAEATEDGQFLWGRSFGNLINDGNDIGYAGGIMSNGDRLCVGYYYHSTYNLKTFIARLNAQGDTVWTKSYGSNSGQQIGYCLYISPNDDIYVGGTTTTGGGLLLMKLNSNGTLAWAKTYVTPAGRILKILEKNDTTLLLCGQSIFNNDYAVTLTNVDLNGTLLWSKDYKVENTDNEQFFEDAFITANDEVYLTGYYYDEVNYVTPGNKPFFMKTDASGNVLWSKRYTDYYGEGRVIIEHPNGGILWGGIHMQNAFTPYWPKQPEIWWAHMNNSGSNPCFTSCNMLQTNTVTSVSNKFFTRFSGYVTDNPTPSATNFLTLKTPKCNGPLNLEESESFEFKILPNPNSGKFQLQLSWPYNAVIRLFNALGELQSFTYEPNISYDLDLLPGIYFLQILGTDHIEKFIVH
jgi:hypothetical protein